MKMPRKLSSEHFPTGLPPGNSMPTQRNAPRRILNLDLELGEVLFLALQCALEVEFAHVVLHTRRETRVHR